jgi:hypothetical protein
MRIANRYGAVLRLVHKETQGFKGVGDIRMQSR